MAFSLNSILTTKGSKKVKVKRPTTAIRSRPMTVDANFLKITSLRRPPSPLRVYASESHIHRIRTATSRLESKAQFKHTSPASASASRTDLRWSQSRHHVSLPRFNQLPAIAEEDEDETESIDWTAPLDITSYLYKREYIREPNQNDGWSRDEKANWPMVGPCPSMEEIAEALQQSASGKDGEAEKTLIDSICLESLPDNSDDISSPVKKRKSKSATSLLDKGIPDYLAMVKDLNNEIRDLKLETKRMEIYSPRANKLEEPREDTKARAYETLKQMYWLNPSLTECAAKKHICGPPGNHWMGLTRVEVMDVMKRVRRNVGASPRNYKNDPAILSFYNSKFPSTLPPYSNKKSSKVHNKTSKNRKGEPQRSSKPPTPRIKPSQLNTIQHIPGPKHLHTNICIRPWEPTLDGWSQEEDEPDDSELHFYPCATKSRSSISLPPLVGNPTEDAKSIDSIQQEGANNGQRNADEDETQEENDDETDDGGGGDDFITLEIFNPTYRIHR